MTAAHKKCPYCAEEVLAEAKKCKHCGEFLIKGKNFESDHTTTIQMTGKRWKRLRFVGALVLFLGATVFVFVWKPLGAVIMGAGIAVVAVSQMAAWWYHG